MSETLNISHHKRPKWRQHKFSVQNPKTFFIVINDKEKQQISLRQHKSVQNHKSLLMMSQFVCVVKLLFH